MQKYSDVVTGNVNGGLRPLSNATVTVTVAGTSTLASLFSAPAAAKGNPFTGTSDGRVEFYAADGRYDITVTASGYAPVVIYDILLEDPADGGDVSGAADKATPVDADLLALSDSAASFTLKKLTWANLKTTLLATWKDTTGGIAGLTLFKLNLRNAANTFTSFLTNTATAARTWTMPDKDGTVAMTSDFAAPGPIGSTTPAAGSFTTLSATGALTTAGLKEDASGNLGIGVVPSAWNASYKAFQNVAGALVGIGAGEQAILHNAYVAASGNYTYSNTASAARYSMAGNNHYWFTAPSGTAGNPITFTQAMDLDATALTGGVDNVLNLGSGAKRWATVYAGTGTINTSDAREKTDVRALTDDEINAGKALSKEIGIYQFLASVATKGDKARHHVGLTVQRAIEIMEANSLDPFAYGFLCFDQWDDKSTEHPAIEAVEAVAAVEAVLDEDGNVITPAIPAVAAVEGKDAWSEQTQTAGDRYAFRYDQLNLFIAAGLEARITALEAA